MLAADAPPVRRRLPEMSRSGERGRWIGFAKALSVVLRSGISGTSRCPHLVGDGAGGSGVLE